MDSDDDLDVMIKSVPGTEDFLRRRRDLPSSYRLRDLADPNIHVMWLDQQETRRFDGLILNSFEELEESILPHLRTLCPNIYTIGPLHAHLKNKLPKETTMQTVSSTSLWKEDRSCLNWLDEQETKSVIYVSFGSFSTMTKDKLLEIWYGLVNSGIKFLWVIRPGLIGINDDWSSQIPVELSKGTKQRGCIVDWAPQEEVLEHEAVGGFLTHSGWNSTLESICAGVPMISWPFAADQQINSRFVTEVWKIGLDMKDTCNRAVVEKMVKELMVERRDEFSKRVASLAESAANSSGNLNRLIKDIKSWHLGSSMYLNGNIIYNNL